MKYFTLPLANIRNYFLKNGWKFEPFNEYLEKAVNIEEPDLYHMVPTREDLSDYRIHAKGIVIFFSTLEKRNPSAIVKDIMEGKELTFAIEDLIDELFIKERSFYSWDWIK